MRIVTGAASETFPIGGTAMTTPGGKAATSRTRELGGALLVDAALVFPSEVSGTSLGSTASSMSSGRLSTSAVTFFWGVVSLFVGFRAATPLAPAAGLDATGSFPEAGVAAATGCALVFGERFVVEPCEVEDLGSEGFLGADMGGILQELDTRGKGLTRSVELGARPIGGKLTYQGFNSAAADC